MKLKTCLEIGLECGLTKIDEAIFNIELHRMNIFCYDEIQSELNELYNEYKQYNCKKNDLIINKIKELA